jgi:hypothetical protein
LLVIVRIFLHTDDTGPLLLVAVAATANDCHKPMMKIELALHQFLLKDPLLCQVQKRRSNVAFHLLTRPAFQPSRLFERVKVCRKQFGPGEDSSLGDVANHPVLGPTPYQILSKVSGCEIAPMFRNCDIKQ